MFVIHRIFVTGTDIDAFQLFIWSTFLPTLKLVHASDVEIFNEVSGKNIDVMWHSKSAKSSIMMSLNGL